MTIITNSENLPLLEIPIGLHVNRSPVTAIHDPPAEIPRAFELRPNFPNPFNPETVISFQVPEASYVTIKIYNAIGQKITALVQREYVAGLHSVTWNGGDSFGNPVSSGVYFCYMEAGGYTRTRMMTLVR